MAHDVANAGNLSNGRESPQETKKVGMSEMNRKSYLLASTALLLGVLLVWGGASLFRSQKPGNDATHPSTPVPSVRYCGQSEPLTYTEFRNFLEHNMGGPLTKSHGDWIRIKSELTDGISNNLEEPSGIVQPSQQDAAISALVELDLRPLLELDEMSEEYHELMGELDERLQHALVSVPIFVSCEHLLMGLEDGKLPTVETLYGVGLQQHSEESLFNRFLLIYVISIAYEFNVPYERHVSMEVVNYALKDPGVQELILSRPELSEGLPQKILELFDLNPFSSAMGEGMSVEN